MQRLRNRPCRLVVRSSARLINPVHTPNLTLDSVESEEGEDASNAEAVHSSGSGRAVSKWAASLKSWGQKAVADLAEGGKKIKIRTQQASSGANQALGRSTYEGGMGGLGERCRFHSSFYLGLQLSEQMRHASKTVDTELQVKLAKYNAIQRDFKLVADAIKKVNADTIRWVKLPGPVSSYPLTATGMVLDRRRQRLWSPSLPRRRPLVPVSSR